jgi:hypothetical protein
MCTLFSSPALERPESEDGQNRAKRHRVLLNPLTPELNPSAQRCLTRFFTEGFASSTVHFVNICLKNQQMKQLFIQFINYVWYLLHVSALHCHPQEAFLVPSERHSIVDRILWIGVLCLMAWCVAINKYTNYSFSLLIIYGISYMFRHYIAILRERS